MKKIITILLAILLSSTMILSHIPDHTVEAMSKTYVTGKGSTYVKAGTYYYKMTSTGIYKAKSKKGKSAKKIVSYKQASTTKKTGSTGYVCNGTYIYYAISTSKTAGTIYRVTVNGKSKTVIRACKHHIKIDYCYEDQLVYNSDTNNKGFNSYTPMYVLNVNNGDEYYDIEDAMEACDTRIYRDYGDCIESLTPSYYGPFISFESDDYYMRVYDITLHKGYCCKDCEGFYIDDQVVYYNKTDHTDFTEESEDEPPYNGEIYKITSNQGEEKLYEFTYQSIFDDYDYQYSYLNKFTKYYVIYTDTDNLIHKYSFTSGKDKVLTLLDHSSNADYGKYSAYSSDYYEYDGYVYKLYYVCEKSCSSCIIKYNAEEYHKVEEAIEEAYKNEEYEYVDEEEMWNTLEGTRIYSSKNILTFITNGKTIYVADGKKIYSMDISGKNKKTIYSAKHTVNVYDYYSGNVVYGSDVTGTKEYIYVYNIKKKKYYKVGSGYTGYTCDPGTDIYDEEGDCVIHLGLVMGTTGKVNMYYWKNSDGTFDTMLYETAKHKSYLLKNAYIGEHDENGMYFITTSKDYRNGKSEYTKAKVYYFNYSTFKSTAVSNPVTINDIISITDHEMQYYDTNDELQTLTY